MANVLIVEDNVIYRELLRELCEMDGHDVTETSSAEEVLALLKSHPEPRRAKKIDLVVVDFNMGKMNGYELITWLRQFEGLRKVSILMISSTEKDIKDVLKMEGVAFLPKPSPNIAVLGAIRRLLGYSPQQPRADDREQPSEPAAVDARRAEKPTLRNAPIEILRDERQYDAVSKKPARRLPLPKALASPPAPPPAAPAKPAPPKQPAEPAPSAAEPLAPTAGLDKSIKSSISQSSQLTEFLIVNQQKSQKNRGAEALEKLVNSPIAELVEKVVDSAIEQNASDIHFEPRADSMVVKVRIDGTMLPLVSLPSSIIDNLTARIKIMCSLDITEKRLPQDGQFSRRGGGGRMTKFRVSTLPAIYGEKIVLRVLPSDTLQIKLDMLGLSPRNMDVLSDVLRAPNGLILVTGPTGSGKTTTLYGMLDALNDSRRNILTVEDPVEYQLKGITQVQINAAIGYTFERVLRAFLRQDPNVILVGEIRDAETAEIALKASVTGHIVLSTLHTNDAASTVCRLVSMGLPPYLVSAACRLVIGQRLIRTLCPECKVVGALSMDEASHLRKDEKDLLSKVWRPRGCASCHGVGYSGRRPVFEVMPISSHEMRKAISADASPDDISAVALKEGMTTMRSEALKMAAAGVTSVEEALTALYV